MRLQSLKHLVSIAQEIAQPDRVIVLGSSSLLGSFPDLEKTNAAIEASLDADLLIEPCDDEMAEILDEALGESRTFEKRYGYHADILRPVITQLLPAHWQDRLVPLAGHNGAFCLEPYDLAVAKLLAGREKDMELIAALLKAGYLELENIRERLRETAMAEKAIAETDRRLDTAAAISRQRDI